MEKKELELYIHIPFCVKKCDYCDFLSFSADEQTQRSYVAALQKELVFYGAKYKGRRITTIFIGGGTPSWLREESMQAVMETVYQNFAVDGDAEITIECNPGTITEHKFEVYRRIGINRLSIGLQSVLTRCLAYRLSGMHLRLVGSKGCGKNTLIQTVDWLLNVPQYRMQGNAELDKLDLLGGPTIENGTMRYRLSDMLRYLAAGADVVLDEGNTIKPECADVLHSLTDAARQIQVPGYGLVQMHPHSAFTITMNEDYAGTNFMNEATIDRFTPIHIAEPESIVDVLHRVVPEASAASLNICDYVYCAIRDRIRSAGGLEPDAMTIRGFIDALRAEPLLGLRWGLLDNVASKPQDAYTRLQLTELIESMVPQDGRI